MEKVTLSAACRGRRRHIVTNTNFTNKLSLSSGMNLYIYILRHQLIKTINLEVMRDYDYMILVLMFAEVW